MAQVVADFKAYSASTPAPPPAVAVIQSLTRVIERSTASTIAGMYEDLRAAAALLQSSSPQAPLSLIAACDLFLRYVTRTSLDYVENFDACKALLIERGEKFAELSRRSRSKIASLARGFIKDGAVVLTHGHSGVVTQLLRRAAEVTHFSVIVTESRPERAGYSCARELAESGVPVTVVLDAAIGQVMERVDLVVVGAEGVVENGGIVNSVGTFPLAVLASACKTPFYVAAESYKFTRIYPLNQSDLRETSAGRRRSCVAPLSEGGAAAAAAAAARGVACLAEGEALPAGVTVEGWATDYTPPSYIALLFTDLGVLTPSAVSDELIKLYN